MPIINKGTSFSNGEQLTADKLNNLVDQAEFNSAATDGSTTFVNSSGQIAIADSGISAGKLAANAVETAKILDANVTLPKIATQADQTVIANVSGGVASPTAVSIVGASGILINDDALGTSDTKGATQGNIKAYVDSLFATSPFTKSFESPETSIPTAGTVIAFSHGLYPSVPKLVQVVLRCKEVEGNYAVGDEVVLGDFSDGGQVQQAYSNNTTVGWGHMYNGTTVVLKNRITNVNFVAGTKWRVLVRAFA